MALGELFAVSDRLEALRRSLRIVSVQLFALAIAMSSAVRFVSSRALGAVGSWATPLRGGVVGAKGMRIVSDVSCEIGASSVGG